MKVILSRKFFGALAFMTLVLVAFQNCGKEQAFNSSTLESTSFSSTTIGGHSAPHITTLAKQMAPNTNLDFKLSVDAPLSNPTYLWTHQLNSIVNACQVISGSTAQNYTVNCRNEGNLKVSVNVMQAGVKVAVQDFLIPLVMSGPPVGSLNVTYQIPPGTGSGAWNPAAAPIEVYIGQTLTIQNGDSVKHQLHTGGRPCPHGTAFNPGESFNCIITSAHNSVLNGGTYDHALGTGSKLNIIAHDGALLYSQNCMSCHGELATSQHRNASYAQIQSALTSVSQMSSNANLMKLTPKQIEAISFMLSK